MNNLEQYYLDNEFQCDYKDTFGILDDFPGYTICRDGSVWSNKVNKDWKNLTIQTNWDGYKYILLLDKNGKQRKCKIHRLLAMAFIPNPKNKIVVYHKDNDRSNNNIDNLYWDIYDNNYKRTDKHSHPNCFEISNINKNIGLIIKKYYPNHTPTELGKFHYMTTELQKEILDYVSEYYNSKKK